jgi:hypothetical protein
MFFFAFAFKVAKSAVINQLIFVWKDLQTLNANAKKCAISNILQKVKSNFLPISIIHRLVPIKFETLKPPNVDSPTTVWFHCRGASILYFFGMFFSHLHLKLKKVLSAIRDILVLMPVFRDSSEIYHCLLLISIKLPPFEISCSWPPSWVMYLPGQGTSTL